MRVGNHGRDHRAQPDLGIGFCHGLHALDARRWKFEEQVVAGGRALLDVLDGMDERREVLVLVGAAAADPRCGIEEEIKLPEIAEALGQAAVAVGVGVDQAGNNQTVAGVDDFGIGVPHCPGRDNVGDDIAFDDDIARLAAHRRDKTHQSVCDHEHGNRPSGGASCKIAQQRGIAADVNSRNRMVGGWFASPLLGGID